MLALGASNSLDVKFYYNGDQARALLNGLNETHRHRYLLTEFVDCVFIVSYSTALFMALTSVFGRGVSIIALSLFPGICDAVETLGVIFALMTSADHSYFDWLGVMTCLKWSVGGIALVLLPFGVLRAKFAR